MTTPDGRAVKSGGRDGWSLHSSVSSLFLRMMVIVLGCFGMSPRPTCAQLPPRFTSHPASLSVGEGLTATFAAVAGPRDRYAWYRDGEALPQGLQATLVIRNVGPGDMGFYAAVASNDAGSATSQVARLAVVPRAEIRPLATIPTPGGATWVKVLNGIAYVAAQKLEIYDVTTPTNVVLLHSHGDRTGRITSVFPIGKTAYYTDGARLGILDISDAAKPMLMSRLQLLTTGLDVVAVGTTVYVATGRGMEIIDATDLRNPVRLGDYRAGDGVFTVDIAGEVAYLAAPQAGYQVVDISDPARPVLLRSLKFGGFSLNSKSSGNRLYLAAQDLFVCDLDQNPREPVVIGSRRQLGRYAGATANGMTAAGDFVIYGGGDKFLTLLDTGDPRQFAVIDERAMPGTVEGIDISGRLIFVARVGGMEILEWAPATKPPVATRPAERLVAVSGSPIRLEGHASAGEPLAWQWYHDGHALPMETNRTLRISAVTELHAGTYATTTTSSAGSITVENATVSLIPAPPLDLTIKLPGPTPMLSAILPEGLQTRFEVSDDLTMWRTLWSGQIGSEPWALSDSEGYLLPQRFYRLRYGIE
jgi:hypothetical protein